MVESPRKSRSPARGRARTRSASRSISRSSRSGSRSSYSSYTSRSRSRSYSSSRSSRSSRSYSRSLSRSRSRSRSYSRSRSRSPRRIPKYETEGRNKPSGAADPYNKKLFITPISASVEADHLKEIFANYGTVTDVIVPTRAPTQRSLTGKSLNTGIAFVTLSTRDEADAALKCMNDGWLDGHQIHVTFYDASKVRRGSRVGKTIDSGLFGKREHSEMSRSPSPNRRSYDRRDDRRDGRGFDGRDERVGDRRDERRYGDERRYDRRDDRRDERRGSRYDEPGYDGRRSKVDSRDYERQRGRERDFRRSRSPSVGRDRRYR
ncbi:uncharacterized protein EV422DRAFT_38110 [Fimicolochytrium jonesii]|uniref:uncharacterized protein n=1 Tax=Fimicolochytrium jonesii TaxID=1396493 RepID=UPI0022FE513B|nr:uncharacterized protein EV422DRAFT_38110 [Fimicolochytrium jonesii]KAI8821324.1 hypothetical protein EV422DRAFT_38110 [Fimicolochytrium jonesii]